MVEQYTSICKTIKFQPHFNWSKVPAFFFIFFYFQFDKFPFYFIVIIIIIILIFVIIVVIVAVNCYLRLFLHFNHFFV